MLPVTLFAAFLGLSIGSFVNVVILRSVESKKLTGRSRCPHCQHVLSSWDLIPLVSYIYLRGKCRYCHKTLSVQYPLVEGVTGILFGLTTYYLFSTYGLDITASLLITLLIYYFVLSIFVALFVTDLRFGLIPNRIIIPGIIGLLLLKTALLVALVAEVYFNFKNDSSGLGQYLLPPHSSYLYTYAARVALNHFFDLLTGIGIASFFTLLIVVTKGRAMGGGDIKLGFFIGVLNGWPLALVGLLLAFVLGALFAVMLLFLRLKRFGQTLPFGPFLIIGSLIALFFGHELFEWYLGLMG
jgi:leader peptidase (prepilin peptidase)/N-methyltransferase